jgi:hypothetical protein
MEPKIFQVCTFRIVHEPEQQHQCRDCGEAGGHALHMTTISCLRLDENFDPIFDPTVAVTDLEAVEQIIKTTLLFFQLSTMAVALATFINNLGQNAVDSNLANLVTALTTAQESLSAPVVTNAAFASDTIFTCPPTPLVTFLCTISGSGTHTSTLVNPPSEQIITFLFQTSGSGWSGTLICHLNRRSSLLCLPWRRETPPIAVLWFFRMTICSRLIRHQER